MKKFFFIDFDNTIFSHRTGSIPERHCRLSKKTDTNLFWQPAAISAGIPKISPGISCTQTA